jgi:hypothetical protein
MDGDDGLTRYYGSVCVKCGQEPRAFGQRWGTQCLEASQRWWANYTEQTAREEMGYGPAAPRATDPNPAPLFQPRGQCQRCGASQWVGRGEGLWGCASCGTNPADPTMRKPV